MAGPDERTLRMMEQYVELFDSGHTMIEIAATFDLSTRTVRDHLPEIAEREGRTYESLLNHPHKPPANPPKRKITRFDREEFLAKANELLVELENLSSTVDKAITDYHQSSSED